jgi:hypothetical protein
VGLRSKRRSPRLTARLDRAGTGEPGVLGDGGPAVRAQLCQPHSIAFDEGGNLLVCDMGNGRVRAIDTQGRISTLAGSRERAPTPDAAPLAGTPLRGPRSIDTDGPHSPRRSTDPR